MDAHNKALLQRYRERLNQSHEAPGKTARRFFGMDFLFVVFFLVIGFYFFWPTLFQAPGRYAPEKALNASYACFVELEQLLLQGKQAGRPLDDILDDIAGMSPYADEKPPIRFFVLDLNHNILLGEKWRPDYWKQVVSHMERRKRGYWVFASHGQAVLYFFEAIPELDLRVIVSKPFPPLFR